MITVGCIVVLFVLMMEENLSKTQLRHSVQIMVDNLKIRMLRPFSLLLFEPTYLTSPIYAIIWEHNFRHWLDISLKYLHIGMKEVYSFDVRISILMQQFPLDLKKLGTGWRSSFGVF